MRTIDNARKAMKKVGFEILYEEDLAERESPNMRDTTKLLSLHAGDDPVPWYYPLEGDLRKAQTTWDSEWHQLHVYSNANHPSAYVLPHFLRRRGRHPDLYLDDGKVRHGPQGHL